MIEVFKTDIKDPVLAAQILEKLHLNFYPIRFNLDIDDCDCVLRAVGTHVKSDMIIEFLSEKNFFCQILDS